MSSSAPALFLALLLSVGACRDRPAASGTTGQLDVQWSGRQNGGLAGVASAGWCPRGLVLEISTVKGDTGIALALYPGKTLAPGVYRVVDPVRAESVPPSAGVAVRWLSQNTVQGFQGDSGQVELKRTASGHLSGTLTARARSVVDTQRILLTGTFRDLPVVSDSLGCEPADTSVPGGQPDDTGDDIGDDTGDDTGID